MEYRMRKNIFELLSEDFDVGYEIQTIWRLFTRETKIDTVAGWVIPEKNIRRFTGRPNKKP
jgi:hypothetical protein